MRGESIGREPIRVPEGRGLSEALRLVLYVFALALPFLVYVALSVRQVSEDYRLSTLVLKRQALSREHERLLLERAALLSPARVDRISAESLNMVPEDAQGSEAPGGKP